MTKSSRAFLKLLAYAALVLGVMTFQTTILHFAPFEMIVLDLGLIVVVWVGLAKGPRPGMLMGFVIGLVEDSLSGCPMGTNALIKTLIGGSAGVISGRMLPNSPVAQILALFSGSLMSFLLQYSIAMITTSVTQIPSDRFVTFMLAGTLTTTVVGIVLFRILGRIRFFRPARVPEAVIEKEWQDAG